LRTRVFLTRVRLTHFPTFEKPGLKPTFSE
jgi:hypothetical protein